MILIVLYSISFPSHVSTLTPFLTVPPGKLEGDHVYRVIPEDDSSLEVSSPRDQQSPILPPGAPARKDTDKTARRKVSFMEVTRLILRKEQ